MNLSFHHMLVGLSVALSPFGLAEERWWDVVPANEKSPFRGGQKSGSDKLSAEVKSVLQQEKFEEWVQYEDEFVSFEYPKHELIKFEVKKPQRGIKVEGGVCTSVDNSFTQAYILNVGELTYGVMLLNPAQWLDDGICLCGPMVHHAYQIKNSTVKRFSMLPSGAVKKAQVVGGGLRFMAFEWTHLACPRSVYEQMVNSISLKTKEPGGDLALKKKLVKMYGEDGTLGMIAKGAEVAEIVKAFGEPLKKSKSNLWTWKWVGEQYPITLNAQVKDGKLVSLPDAGLKKDWDNPVHGSKAWCSYLLTKKLNKKDSGFVLSSSEKEVLINKITEILTQNIGKTMGDYGGEWFEATYLANEAAKQGLTDEKWTNIIRKNAVGNWAEIAYMKESKASNIDGWCLGIFNKIKNLEIKSIRDENVIELAEIFGESNTDGWRKLAPELWESGNTQLKAAALTHPNLIDQKIMKQWIIEVVEHENAESLEPLLSAAVGAVSSMNWDEKDRLTQAIERLPTDGASFSWESVRASALESLRE